MNSIFPVIDNINNNHTINNKTSYKLKRLKLNINKSLKTYNTERLKTKFFSNFTKSISPNIKFFRNNNKFMNTIEDFSQKVKEKPIKEYVKLQEDLMEKYSYNNPKVKTEENIINYEDEMTKTKANYFRKKKKDIQLYLNRSKKLMKTMRDFNPQKAIIKIDNTEFKNPVDSLGLILKNKTIHDRVLDSYQNREFQTYGNNIRKINKIKGTLSLSKNVKITNIFNFLQSMKNNNNQNDISNSLNEEKSNEKRELLSEDKKQYQNSFSPLIKNDQSHIISTSVLQKGFIYLLPGYFQSTKTCPESREEFSFNYDRSTNSIFLFSGNSSDIDSPSLWKFNLFKFNWEPIKATNDSPNKRFGHTSIIYKSKLIIFGGRFLHNTSFGDIDIYNIEQKCWEINNYNSIIFLKLRRNHVSCLVGSQMFIHGGIDEEGKYLNDSFLFSLNNNSLWAKVKINNFRKHTPFPKLAYHSCCLVVPYEIQIHPRFNIYKFPEIPINSKIKEKGIYIFGGKKGELKEPSNKMWLLRIGKKYLDWMEIMTLGKPPCPRYLFSMNFYEQENFIIIHGGKTKSLKSEQILNDTFLFELMRFQWIKVLHGCFDQIVKPRFSHAGIIYNKRLIIFGGVNEQGFSGSNFFLVKLSAENNEDIFYKDNNAENKRLLVTMKTHREIKDYNNEESKMTKNLNNKEENSKNKNKNKKINLTTFKNNKW